MTKLVFLETPSEEPRPNYPKYLKCFQVLTLSCGENHCNLLDLLSWRKKKTKILFPSTLCFSEDPVYVCVIISPLPFCREKTTLQIGPIFKLKVKRLFFNTSLYIAANNWKWSILNLIFETPTLPQYHKTWNVRHIILLKS